MKRWICIALTVLFFLLPLSSCKSPSGEAQEITWRSLTWAVGAPLPSAEMFAASLPEGTEVRYAEEYSFHAIGEYTLTLIVTDKKGRESRQDVQFKLVLDQEAPTLVGVRDLTVYLGEGVSYREGISVSDNCDGEVDLVIDSSKVNLKEEGSYPVTYVATDAAGNYIAIEIHVYVYAERMDAETLYALLDPVIAGLIPPTASTEQKVRAVYTYVYDSIAYSATSEKGDWVRAAYEGLRTGVGDCYTYYALAKAFFERLGIENMDIERTKGLTDERHYWNYVNIGTKEAPQWYHFDATLLRGVQHSGCLLTDAQVDAYTRIRVDENGVTNYFYAYDKRAYPASASVIITPTPSLDAYL